jgi:hypothetical protein
MRGNNRGIFAASHSSVIRVVGVEAERPVISSTLLTTILISVLTPIPAKSTRSSAATIVPGMQQFSSRTGTPLGAFRFNASRTRSVVAANLATFVLQGGAPSNSTKPSNPRNFTTVLPCSRVVDCTAESAYCAAIHSFTANRVNFQH